jgi:hypothetical protein
VKQRKRRTRLLFRFGSTKLVIFKPAISDSNKGWIDPKLDNLILYLGHFNVLIWFENWVSKALNLRDVRSDQFVANSEHSSFGK